ncbi:FIG00616163: hypothetical protein [hydrothermal vent metagenome]|uniref:VTT domain-containing protein n=1 Tax=hydrothermal vent metagenome TaxID=652676 RepID=A0A3B0R4S5_9ZZZZ
MNVKSTHKLVLAGIIILTLAALYWWGDRLGLPSELPNGDDLRAWFDTLGVVGPVAVIALMVVAILVSPLPSAPIALAAGAVYGHVWGTLYVLVGSEIGALAAFAIARFFGFDLLHKWFGKQLNSGLAGSQNVLMFTVFASRLLPFISFDIVSYAAGLTALKFWRFAIATLAGIIPASFFLAHVGSELVAGETDRILFAVGMLGLLTALPILVKLFARFRRKDSS